MNFLDDWIINLKIIRHKNRFDFMFGFSVE